MKNRVRQSYLKKQYLLLFAEARKIINRHDPMALDPSVEAPEDEYDQETRMILPLLHKGLTLDQLAEQLDRVFSKQFGTWPSESHEPFKPLAADLIELVERRK